MLLWILHSPATIIQSPNPSKISWSLTHRRRTSPEIVRRIHHILRGPKSLAKSGLLGGSAYGFRQSRQLASSPVQRVRGRREKKERNHIAKTLLIGHLYRRPG